MSPELEIEEAKQKVSVMEKANEIYKEGDPYTIGMIEGFLMGLNGKNAKREIEDEENK